AADGFEQTGALNTEGSASGKLVGTVMRFSEEKQPFLWLDAMRIVAKACPEVRFVMIGSGPLLNEAKARATDLLMANRIEFTGTRSDVYSLMASLDVFVLCSTVEGLPNVLLEAQAAGTPVVSLNVGGCREAFEHDKTGVLVEPKDAKSLA